MQLYSENDGIRHANHGLLCSGDISPGWLEPGLIQEEPEPPVALRTGSCSDWSGEARCEREEEGEWTTKAISLSQNIVILSIY